ncbi:hypothetical protein [Sphingomonas melonis]|uniref:hypothetical protein n=1 Tax=Sphingomonas melonis TaxID=152682 RepID=UPI0035C8754E
MKVNAILLKPLDGYEPGSPRQFDKPDFDRLVAMNAVRGAGDADEVEEVPDTEDAVMLDRLRHPVDGPKILADLKARFERQASEIVRMIDQENASRATIETLTAARDGAIAERDAAVSDLTTAREHGEAVVRERDELLAEVARLQSAAADGDTAPGSKAKPGKA